MSSGASDPIPDDARPQDPLRVFGDLDGLHARWISARPPRLAFAGEIDLTTAARFDAVIAHTSTVHDQLTLDLTAVEFLSSIGIAILFRYRERLTTVLVGESGHILRVLTMASFPRSLITVVSTPAG